MRKEGTYNRLKNGVLERVFDFSLSFRQIRPLAVFGARRKAALRGAGYTWTPDLRSFDKLQEVGVSPYLGFIPSLSTLSMFELNEVVRGRSQIFGLNCYKFFKLNWGIRDCHD